MLNQLFQQGIAVKILTGIAAGEERKRSPSSRSPGHRRRRSPNFASDVVARHALGVQRAHPLAVGVVDQVARHGDHLAEPTEG